jgi:Subtilase family/MBG domain/PKD domain
MIHLNFEIEVHLPFPPLAGLVCIFLSCPLLAQERLAEMLSDPTVRLSKPADRAWVVAHLKKADAKRRLHARERASRLGLPLRSVSANGRIQEIVDFSGDRPLYLTTQNLNAAVSTAADRLWTSPHSLTGAGVTIGLWDAGAGRSTHQEFGGRLTVMDGSSSANHSTHVSGTLIASGADPTAKGMAPGASVKSYDWLSDITEMTAAGATYPGEPDKIYLSNHSYGFVSGWNYVGSSTRTWEWYGAGSSSAQIEDDFGRYNENARESDALAFDAPYYLVFRSAGNDRLDNPTPGQNVSLSPGGAVVPYSASLHPAGDGIYRSGFDTIGYDAIAKNVITIGSVTDAATDGLRAPSVALSSSFSSCGPTDDGRIKPDLVANGSTVHSSIDTSDTAYATYSGTSMAAPNAAGSSALLVQQFGSLFPSQAMRSSTLKGLLIHTADDLGNAGPDYKFGWGLVNVQSAADHIRNHYDYPNQKRITEGELSSTTITQTHSFLWDGISPISATLCWTDPASISTATSDSRSARLVNNLDLKITTPRDSDALPFVMPFIGNWTQASMNLPATTGTNQTDNVEQVQIATPAAAGVYHAVVSFSGTLAGDSQNYSLLISGASATPPPLVVSSIAPDSAPATRITLDLTGTDLRADTSVKLARHGHSDIFASGLQMIGGKLRCQMDLAGAAPGAWDVVAIHPDSESFALPGGFTVLAPLWSESFEGSVSTWAWKATTGSNTWSRVPTPGATLAKSYFAPGHSNKSTTQLTGPTFVVPTTSTHLQLRFWHSYNLQTDLDVGKLELSTNGGYSWFDVQSPGSGASFASHGYNSTVSSAGSNSSRNEFAGQRAWSGNSNGLVETVIHLTDTAKYAGKSLRVRWRIATNNGTASPGWYLDSVALYGDDNLPNQPPIITSTATSTSTTSISEPPHTYQIIRTDSTGLTAAASDDGDDDDITYTWAVDGTPPHPVIFSVNATHEAQSSTATFEGPGDYQITVTVRDTQGLSAVSTVRLRVVPTATDLFVSPSTAVVPVGTTQQFSATLLDQFGLTLFTHPSTIIWETNGGGSITPAGLFSAVSAGDHTLITARHAETSNTAVVASPVGTASVVLENLSQTFDGMPKPVTVKTSPENLTVVVTYDGNPTPPTAPGTYAVSAVVDDTNRRGIASEILIIAPGNDYIAWTSIHFSEPEKTNGLADDLADADDDGQTNLTEYALGTHPRQFTPHPVPTRDAEGLSFHFTRPANLPGVTYAVESSEDLMEWRPALLEVITFGATESMRARDSLDIGDPARRFLRLRIGRQ